jgi:hypothetical protein
MDAMLDEFSHHGDRMRDTTNTYKVAKYHTIKTRFVNAPV